MQSHHEESLGRHYADGWMSRDFFDLWSLRYEFVLGKRARLGKCDRIHSFTNHMDYINLSIKMFIIYLLSCARHARLPGAQADREWERESDRLVCFSSSRRPCHSFNMKWIYFFGRLAGESILRHRLHLCTFRTVTGNDIKCKSILIFVSFSCSIFLLSLLQMTTEDLMSRSMVVPIEI